MPRTEKDKLGQFIQLKQEMDSRGFLSRVPTDKIRAELRARHKLVPIVDLMQQVIELGQGRGIAIEPERLVYFIHKDCLGRPEISLGYNRSDMSLEEIKAEDEQIKRREILQRGKGEGPILWSELFVIYEPGKVRARHGDGNQEQFSSAVNRFVEEIILEKTGAQQI